VGLGIAHMNLLQNNLRPNQDYESNPVMRIIKVIHVLDGRSKAEPIRDLPVVSIDINKLRGWGLAAQARSDMEKEEAICVQ
jgi:hypothetical protein